MTRVSDAAADWTITRVRYDSAAARVLTLALHREQLAVYGSAEDPEDTPPGDFESPSGLFLLALTRDGTALACGGWRTVCPATGEIKRMYVTAGARGHGLGRRILKALEHDAGRRGITRVILETGVRNHAALALYTRSGYSPVTPYVTGRDPRINRAMTKMLRSAPP
ncbi:GNAT family N-acetyltransferase [Amycolatopsis sp. NPDC004079]|uniref:GNAT family N-acetyltransferase n=1 Tax=Amycolatopsis sp. NPDC004079 TaxID=3154549 RepID=UPI0033B10009